VRDDTVGEQVLAEGLERAFGVPAGALVVGVGVVGEQSLDRQRWIRRRPFVDRRLRGGRPIGGVEAVRVVLAGSLTVRESGDLAVPQGARQILDRPLGGSRYSSAPVSR